MDLLFGLMLDRCVDLCVYPLSCAIGLAQSVPVPASLPLSCAIGTCARVPTHLPISHHRPFLWSCNARKAMRVV